MEYKVLYRKYRPDTFEKIVGQDYTVNILKNAIINKKIAHAYIFNGPRGTGKTSTAKVFAKTINCENPINGEACGKCNSCQNIINNPDIIEIDAASNNGVDEIRELINNIKIAPSYSKYKVYIIDEVHMMTQSAFNALLLTLEEPPEHIVFILATTNIESVPITILSRCQKFDFKKISNDVIKENIKKICKNEKIDISKEAIDEITYLSEGGMRDALSILDQLSSENNKIDLDLIINNFGSVPNIIIDNIIKAISTNNLNIIKENIEKLKNSNVDYKVFIKKLIDKLSIMAYDENKILNIEQIKNIIFDLVKIINNYNININPFVLIELTLLEYMNHDIEQNMGNIVENVEKVPKNVKKDQKIEEKEPEIISREIILEEKEDETIQNMDKFIKTRINNCFVNAQKQYLTDSKTIIKNIMNNNSDDKFLISMLIDSEVIAASDKIYIFTSQLDSIVNLINMNHLKIEEKLEDIKVVALTTEEWEKEKKEYIQNIKKGYKYEMIEESTEVEEISQNSEIDDSMENIAEQLFSTNKIEIE